MDLLLNDLSLEGQFSDISTFRDAIARVMAIRQIAHRYGRALYCHRGILHAQVTSNMIMPQAVNMLTVDQRRSVLQWLTQHGPFWEDTRNHSPDEYFEHKESVVTDTALGEAAWCCLNGIEQNLVSFSPSSWEFSPISIDWVHNDSFRQGVNVINFWESLTIESVLRTAPTPIQSWKQLKTLATARCTNLTFIADAFANLDGCPFVSSAAQRIFIILETLDRFKTCFNEKGQRTSEGHEMYRNYFTGKKGNGGRGSVFSDSSDEEKIEFKTELTFKSPADENTDIFCPWHGKIQTPQFRVHFSWPITANEPLFIVYVGEKITKR